MKKIIITLVFGCLGIVYFKLGANSKDLRLAVQAVHTPTSYPYCADWTHNCLYGCIPSSSGGRCVSMPPTPAPYCADWTHNCLNGCIPSSSGGSCVPMPPTPAPPTAVPTPVIVYSCSGNPYCTNTCTDAVSCSASVTCYSSDENGARNCENLNNYTVYQSRCCGTPTGTTKRTCTSCYDYSGGGWYDDCGGSGTGSCPGAGAVVPTELPGGGISTCNCADYSSEAAATCNTTTFYCPTSNPAVYCYGMTPCAVPTIGSESLVIKNADNMAVSAGGSSRNNICEKAFTSSSNSRMINLVVTVSDTDGYTLINQVRVRWHGQVSDDLTFVSGSENQATYSGTMNFSEAMNDGGTYPIEIEMVNSHGDSSGWVDSGRNLKVWNCQVTVSGTMYDSSAGRSCNVAFSNTIPAGVGFLSMNFADVSGTNTVPMAVNSPNYGSGNLTWGRDYLPLVNGGTASNPEGDLQGTGRSTQIIDLGTGLTSCPVATQFNLAEYVSAYSPSPQAKVNLSYLRNQEGWFQVAGAGIAAKKEIGSGVPFTMTESLRALTVAGSNSDNGLVSFSTFSNINGNNEDSDYGRPNNWWVEENTNDGTVYNYQYFYNNFLIKKEVGVTGTVWAGKPSEGVYFVNGDLDIDSDFTLDPDKFFMVVVKGKIAVDTSVTNLDGVYVADKGIEILGNSEKQLVINGILYSRGKIRLARSYTDKNMNNNSPAIKINYNPGLIFNMPGKLMEVMSGWREE